MDRKHQQYADIINWNLYETIKYFRRYWLRLGKRIQWLWTATGETLLRTTLDAEGATETKRYAGGFTYRDADGSGANEEALDPFGHAGGRVRSYESGDQLAYPYAFSDPLGNTRVLAEPAGAGIVQKTAYYPYGLQIADLGGESSTNEELYNGKERAAPTG